MMPTPPPSYVSHYLQVGSLLCPMVLVRPLEHGGFELEPFTGECARTVFLEGTLRLEAPTCPLATEPRRAPLAELQQLLAEHSGWQLLLPSVQ